MQTPTTGQKNKPVIVAPFRPLPWQIPAWRDTSRVLLLEGPSGGGKSRLAAEKIHGYMLKYPGSTGIAGRRDQVSAKRSVVQLLKNTVQGGRSGWGTYYKQEGLFQYNNGSQLWIVGVMNEQQRENLRSIGQDGKVDIAWFEEANKISEEVHNELLVRLRGTAASWRQIIYTTNPDHPQHWIHKRLMIGGEAAVYRSTERDNPYNPDDFGSNLALLTGVQRKRLKDGLWAWAEGVVYENFSTDIWPEGNLTDDEPNPDLPIQLGVDDGYVDPRAILFIQKRGAEILVFDEMYHTRHLEETCIKEVIDRCNLWPWMDRESEEYKKIINEAAAKTRRMLPEIAIISHEATQLRRRFREADIVARQKVHGISEGVNLVRSLVQDGQGYRTLKVHRRCRNFIEELTAGYKYPDNMAKRNSENPEDKNNHAADAFRMWAFARAK